MPSEVDHLAQAKENEEFTDFLLASTQEHFFSWGVSGLFYAAVHYGRAFLQSQGAPAITSHPGFETHFLRFSGDQGLYNLYRTLKDESERARYDCAKYTKDEVLALKQKYLTPFRNALSIRRSP